MTHPSHVRGQGYGDKHTWQRHGTDMSPAWQNRSTLFTCRKCNEVFRHWYNQIPDIFEAMKYQGTKEDCV